MPATIQVTIRAQLRPLRTKLARTSQRTVKTIAKGDGEAEPDFHCRVELTVGQPRLALLDAVSQRVFGG